RRDRAGDRGVWRGAEGAGVPPAQNLRDFAALVELLAIPLCPSPCLCVPRALCVPSRRPAAPQSNRLKSRSRTCDPVLEICSHSRECRTASESLSLRQGSVWRNDMIKFKLLGALALLSILSLAQPSAHGSEGHEIVASPLHKGPWPIHNGRN